MRREKLERRKHPKEVRRLNIKEVRAKVIEALEAKEDKEALRIMREFKYQVIETGEWPKVVEILLILPETKELAERILYLVLKKKK